MTRYAGHAATKVGYWSSGYDNCLSSSKPGFDSPMPRLSLRTRDLKLGVGQCGETLGVFATLASTLRTQIYMREA